ncbi:hypothetical protein QE611_05065 [Streptococcus suis]|uniref:hypothetical protein n=1 Tax=Streptococcus suis TaxID=1307 RepID=UPI002AA4CD13|nr:hypothetical protein [Streptococcus suis]
MKRQSVRIKLFPLKKEEIPAYLDDKGILVNAYFKTYLAHPAYQEVVEEQQECLVEIVSLADMGFDREATAPQIEERAVEMGYQLPPAHLGVYLRLALLKQEVSQDNILSQGKSPDGAICLLSPQLEEEFAFPRSVYLRKVDQDLWLRAARFDDEYAFPLTTLFAFVTKNANEFVVGSEP